MVRERELTIIAQDPGVRANGRILTARVILPWEELSAGPRGSRVHVVDYDSSTHTLYQPLPPDPEEGDRFRHASGPELISNPHFHAQNVYAIVMRTLQRFEAALGRRVSWSFGGHQIKVAPHAFGLANALYSREHEALLFGYFPAARGRGVVHTCLSHDIVAHETAHALLDGLRERYRDPSSPDQAAFHEGFADLVALLSVFSLPEAMAAALPRRAPRAGWNLRENAALGLARQFGRELSGLRSQALRRSVALKPSRRLLQRPEFQAPHRRGEILVAAMMSAFVAVWQRRVDALQLGTRKQVADEGAALAGHLLTMAIRALDYTPPTDIAFGDYLSALLTADFEAARRDVPFGFRAALRRSFARFAIAPTSAGTGTSAAAAEPGLWVAADQERGTQLGGNLDYGRVHLEALQRDPQEVFNFIWDNRGPLRLCDQALTRVQSVRPCVRVGADGFVLRETVAEYVQTIEAEAGELAHLSTAVRKPEAMPDSLPVTLYGGGVLVFDEFGKLKYHIHNSLQNGPRQSRRLDYLWRSGYFHPGFQPGWLELWRQGSKP
ncbi:MAG: hypothetical protein NTZ56_15580 [Acidobacteria bacterium]|nr:hypothetical protein [Acidobacteriota bacterium]